MSDAILLSFIQLRKYNFSVKLKILIMVVLQFVSVCALIYSAQWVQSVKACVPNFYNLRHSEILSLLAKHNLTTQIQKDYEATQKRLKTYNLKQDWSDYFEKENTVNIKPDSINDMHLQYIAMLVNDVNYLVDLLLGKEQNCTYKEVPILSKSQNMFQTTQLPLPFNILINEAQEETKISNNLNLETKLPDENLKEMERNIAKPEFEKDYTLEEINDYELDYNVEEIDNDIPDKINKQPKWAYIPQPTSIWLREPNQTLLWENFLKNGKK